MRFQRKAEAERLFDEHLAAINDGVINHPDVDLADPEWNTSGVPWHTLYYKDNYPRLQQVKARWGPRNVFRHALSICPRLRTPSWRKP